MGKPTFDRAALALRIFDDVICPNSLKPGDSLSLMLTMIAGLGGYLATSSTTIADDLRPLPQDLAGIGEAIRMSALIAGHLADEIGTGGA